VNFWEKDKHHEVIKIIQLEKWGIRRVSVKKAPYPCFVNCFAVCFLTEPLNGPSGGRKKGGGHLSPPSRKNPQEADGWVGGLGSDVGGGGGGALSRSAGGRKPRHPTKASGQAPRKAKQKAMK